MHNPYEDNDMLVSGNYYDSKELFRINDNPKITTETFNDNSQKVIIVDDFYTNPDGVRHLGINSVSSKAFSLGYPGFRCKLNITRDENYDQKWIQNLINNNFEEKVNLYHHTLDIVAFNLSKSSKVYDWDFNMFSKACHPHIDSSSEVKYAAVVFLNRENEFETGVNGTGFYKHISTGISDANFAGEKEKDEIFNWNRKFRGKSSPTICTDWVNDGNEYWEMTHLAQMKYNRLVIYPSTYFHQAYYNNNDFGDSYHRLVQAMFLEGVYI